MKEVIVHQVIHFLQKTIDKEKPILLGFSGGADSFSLFHILYTHSYNVHLLHIDHGWREESAQEAEFLKKYAVEHNIPFYLEKTSPEKIQGNLEDGCRKFRYSMYVQWATRINAQCIMLGHNKDDLQETVFVRFLEGSSFMNLACMQKETTRDRIYYIRPLLDCTKEEIVHYAELHQLPVIHDRTNTDSKFLRAKLRAVIFPFLRTHFGKQFEQNLFFRTKEAHLYSDFVHEHINRQKPKPEKGPFGTLYDCAHIQNYHIFEWQELVRILFSDLQITCPRQDLQNIASFLFKNAANKKLQLQSHTIHIDRKKLFILNKPQEKVEIYTPLKEGVKWGGWRVEKISTICYDNATFWKDIWKGKIHFCVQENALYLGPYNPSLVIQTGYQNKNTSSHLAKLVNNQKIPTFLLYMAPVIINEEQKVVGESFLTKKMIAQDSKQKRMVIELLFEGC